MLLRLFLLIAIVPALELYLLMKVGSLIGVGPTLLLILLTGVVGASLARRQGMEVMQQLQRDLAQGLPPANRLVEGVLVFVGGLLLLTPGIATDVAGLLLIFGPTRRWLAPRVVTALESRVQTQAFGPGLGAPPPRARPANPGAFGPARDPAPSGPERSAPGSSHPFSNPFDDLP